MQIDVLPLSVDGISMGISYYPYNRTKATYKHTHIHSIIQIVNPKTVYCYTGRHTWLLSANRRAASECGLHYYGNFILPM